MKAHILTSGNSKETAIFDLQTTHIQTYNSHFFDNLE